MRSIHVNIGLEMLALKYVDISRETMKRPYVWAYWQKSWSKYYDAPEQNVYI